LLRIFVWSPGMAGEVISAGLAELDQQVLHPALADKVSRFMKGAIGPQVGLEDIVFDADGRVGHCPS
jgi:hypothetical protein